MRKLVSLLVLLLFALPLSAQVMTDEEVEMIPFTSEVIDVQGLYPSTWQTQDTTPGVYLRARDPLDLTAIIMQAREGTADDFIAEVTASFGVEEELAVVETIESSFFTWGIYQFQRTQNNQQLIVDMAVTEDAETGRVYYVLMQTPEIFYDNLHTQVFVPAVQWLSPIQTFTDPEGLFEVPVPTRWSLEETEGYGTLTNLDDTVTIYVDALESDDPYGAVQAFWLTIDPEFSLDYDVEDNDLRVIDDPTRIGELESVIIIDWEDGTDEAGTVFQSVARVYDGVVYMTLIVSDVNNILENDADIAAIDNGYEISALSPEVIEPAEVTPEATEESSE